MSEIIVVNRLTKWYKNLEVLCSISFEVRENEFISIVGPSGCGKTTLLKIIGGVLNPTDGIVLLNGHETSSRNIKGKIGFVFQHPVLLQWRTVADNIKLPLEILDIEVLDDTISKILEFVNLPNYNDKYPKELSGGEEQRVSLARALVFDPLVLLMDEPFGALDAQLRKSMNFELLKIWHDRKKTVIYVTHDIDEAVFMSDKVIILSEKPSKIKYILETNLDRPRKWSLRSKEEYVNLVKEAEELLYLKLK